MTEPRRLLDDSAVSAVDRALLGALASDGPSSRARAAAASALGLGLGAGLAATSGTASATHLAKVTPWLTLAKTAIAVVGVGGLVAVGTWALRRDPEREAARVAAAPSASIREALTPVVLTGTPQPTSPPVVVTTIPVAELPTMTPGADLPSALQGRARPPRAHGAGLVTPPVAVAAAEPSSTLAAETARIDGARATLASGDPRGALDELRAYAKAYPEGVLQREALVLDVDARLALGDTDAMRRGAEAYLSRYPSSPAAPRLRRMLEGSTEKK